MDGWTFETGFIMSTLLKSRHKNGSHDPDYAPIKGDLSSICWDLIQPTCVQNLTTVAAAVPEI